MPSITFSLIRKRHPELHAGNLEQLTVINLSHLEIEEIDNLEVFSHIKELKLDNNNITRIENIEFMNNLEVLDLSYNEISSESVASCCRNTLPASLKFIHLTGNPCADDMEALGAFNDMFPYVNIILGEEGDEGVGEEGDGDDDDDDDGEDDGTPGDGEKENYGDNNSSSSSSNGDMSTAELSVEALLNYRPLDSEAILKLIVERKCKVQDKNNLEFDIQNCIKELKQESDQAIQRIPTLRKTKTTSVEDIDSIFASQLNFSGVDGGDVSSKETNNRVDELMKLSRANRQDTSSFMERLRERSMKHFEERRRVLGDGDGGELSMPSSSRSLIDSARDSKK